MPETEAPADDVLAEGSYYLSRLGLSEQEIARHFETTPTKVRRLAAAYSKKVSTGAIKPDPFDRTFWEDVKKEAEGDFKLTFVSERGFHHSWKSELAKLDGPSLMAIFEASKDFLGSDPNQRFLDYPTPKGYDPLALEREIKMAVEVVSSLLEQRWKEDRGQAMKRSTKVSKLKRAD